MLGARSLLLALAFSVRFCGSYAAIGPTTDLRIANSLVKPDGVERTAVLAEGVFPGPVISGFKGDTFRINVVNELTQESMLTETSIHWHGMFQHGSAWADGAAYITQCPIRSGHSFQYSFGVPDQAGTYWYHSHLSTQYCDGLRGPLIVYDHNDPHRGLYDVDDDSTILTLADWYHASSHNRTQQFPEPNSVLINGLGRTTSTPSSPLTFLNVTGGMRYRIRLINISCHPHFVFSIDSHNLTIIEVDGVNIIPVTVDSITIFASQRYSFVLTANASPDNYWIRANPNKGPSGFDLGINSAVLHYDSAAVAEPAPIPPPATFAPLNETFLHPLVPDEIGSPDVFINLELNFILSDPGVYTVNGATLKPPSLPVLLQILSRSQDPSNLLPSGSVIPLERGKVVELSIPGGVAFGPHPFHLHGHTFSVIRSAGSTITNTTNPIRRDTVDIGDQRDNVTIRFKTDNPGPWMLHCHVDWHLDAGLAIIFAEDQERIAEQKPPSAWAELCSSLPQPQAISAGGRRAATPACGADSPFWWIGGWVIAMSILM